jgi:hypothetical protein
VTIKKARAALSHSVFTGISRNHLHRLLTELTEPFAQPGKDGCTADAATSASWMSSHMP